MPGMLDELKQRAEKAAKDLDDKFKIKSKLDEGARVAGDAVKKGVEVASSGLDYAREEASRINQEHGISEKVTEGFRRAERVVNDSGAKEKASEFVSGAKTTAEDLFGEARSYYESATSAAKASTSAARLPSSVFAAVKAGHKWMKENPGKAAVVSLAFVAGTQAGTAFSSLDTVLLGAGGAGNWLFHSALVPYGLRKLSQKYEAHLIGQEELLRNGRLADADRSRVEFERDLAKYVGAPLLGAFSIAMGAGLVYEAVTGGVVTGFPINLVLGGNPLLSSVWFFGNGLICFHNGYKFFMMALADQEETARVVRDIKGLLPQAEG